MHASAPDPGPDPRRSAGVVLVDRRGWILLQERDEHPRIDPEKWGLAGGHVDPGEDFAAATDLTDADEGEPPRAVGGRPRPGMK
ncbi:NUDIX domain-containing protein [Nocardioides eburneiflavus]|uniref:NUDIX domain-containing protein n=1 Tax=Nocardioides eburneiflavus TaxID=2518372 RepID=A0A4Z1CI95_9ACTN|nr:NUDIX hydrolase [Nocardioides eburneiflavus]TGN65597.1 NUDIX domain-containing protein [Nocardioides eburneiflavus]